MPLALLVVLAQTNLCEGVTCTALDECHDVGVCVPENGTCLNPPLSNKPCDGGMCRMGRCEAPPRPDAGQDAGQAQPAVPDAGMSSEHEAAAHGCAVSLAGPLLISALLLTARGRRRRARAAGR